MCVSRKIYTILLFIFVLLISCQTNLNLPKNNQLHDRIFLLYSAEKDNKWHELSSLILPMFRSKKEDNNNFFSQKGKSKEFFLIDWQIISIKKVDPPAYIPDSSKTVSVAVSMDISIQKNGIKEKVHDQTDYWIFLNGEWFWCWRGWPND